MPSRIVLLAAVLACCVASGHAASGGPITSRALRGVSSASLTAGGTDPRNLISKCTEEFRMSYIDHFNWGNNGRFQHRYFTCKGSYKKGGPIFFYFGNEAEVTLYLNNTGLMWELAPRFGAMLVFAEHRYYGKSLPFQNATGHMDYLTVEQTMADYAELIYSLRVQLGSLDTPVIGFGGSYGGILAAWMRMKYPYLVNGAIAASAPIWGLQKMTPRSDPYAFYRNVTYDASAAAGSAPGCVANVRQTWQVIDKHAQSETGVAFLNKYLGLCNDTAITDEDSLKTAVSQLSSAWDSMAMGNFPYASSYFAGGKGSLPAWPVRAACKSLASASLAKNDAALLKAMAKAVNVYFNASGANTCLTWKSDKTAAVERDQENWLYLTCTELRIEVSSNGKTDMFTDLDYELKSRAEWCKEHFGVNAREYWSPIQWGGHNITAASNVVFSNGEYDPWAPYGVLTNLTDSLVAIIIPQAAHHLDLMFSNPADPAGVTEARAQEANWIQHWLDQAQTSTTA